MIWLSVLIALTPMFLYGAWLINRAEDMLDQREHYFND